MSYFEDYEDMFTEPSKKVQAVINGDAMEITCPVCGGHGITSKATHYVTVDGSGCYECPARGSALKSELDCDVLMKTEAADLIERLGKEKAALLEYAKKVAGCAQCANYRHRCDAVDCNQCAEDCPCKKCKRGSKWEWKGLGDE